ncbi:MAG: M20/M25/M40 family metallo-hydrolase [Gammaproteobacteria bacterium]|nr:M20/M25/M40 family metallo-hydrolase [Gammaproteobacteria bacterium]
MIAHRAAVNSRQRIVLYGHCDVAPVPREDTWRSASPWNCETIDGRIYARGIADNKSTLFAHLQALGEMAQARAHAGNFVAHPGRGDGHARRARRQTDCRV